ncbi:MAG: sugar ABC transporter permease [Verrucomicrobia bacterium]|nr:sugar ABC transporter permease [Verrucomicrobiota bacterium]MBV9644806.1 sugar ABC transporter permease [Verrucomicrobiota bacterium]
MLSGISLIFLRVGTLIISVPRAGRSRRSWLLMFGCGPPFMVLTTLAALGSVPAAELEAAEVDRLSLWRRFRYVILPHARFIITLGIILRTIDAFKVTDLVYQLTRGGPGGTTEVIGVMMFRKAFEAFSVGSASGVAVITLLTAIAFTAIFLFLLNLHKRRHLPHEE